MRTKKGIETVTIAQRRVFALELRKAGYSYRRIAQHLDISLAQAYDDVKGGLAELHELADETAEELRTMETERLDMAIKGIMPFIEAGSAPHAQALVKIIAEKAKLLGLYAPEQHDFITWEDRAIDQIKRGELRYEDLVDGFDSNLATDLFTRAGVPVSVSQSESETDS